MSGGLFVVLLLALLVLVVIAKTAVVVPQQSAYVVERLGKYAATLDAGFHILVPFIDRIRYKHSLKETAIDIPEQVCITRDNVQVSVDGILYLKVLNPQRASYGISDYNFALIQLGQTTLRSEIGKIELDRTFEERTNINISVVAELDKATKTQLDLGARITEVLKQPQFSPMPVSKEVVILYAAINGYLSDIAVPQVNRFQNEFLAFMDANHPQIGEAIRKTKELAPDTEEALKAAIAEFKKGFAAA